MIEINRKIEKYHQHGNDIQIKDQLVIKINANETVFFYP